MRLNSDIDGWYVGMEKVLAAIDTDMLFPGSFDNFWYVSCAMRRILLTSARWEDDNVTTICNGNCSAQINDWNFNVAYDCYGQTLNVGGKLVPADAVSGRYLDGINTACLASLDEDAWCLTESLNWQGSDIIRPDCSVTPSDPQCQDPTNVDSGNQRLANLYSNDVLCSSW